MNTLLVYILNALLFSCVSHPPLSLSLSLCLCLTHIHTHTRKHKHTHTNTHTHALPRRVLLPEGMLRRIIEFDLIKYCGLFQGKVKFSNSWSCFISTIPNNNYCLHESTVGIATFCDNTYQTVSSYTELPPSASSILSHQRHFLW